MDNYLNDPNEWTAIESGTNPPASWNGSQYEIVTAGNPDYGLRGGFSAGGTIAGTVTLLSANPWNGSELFFTIAINDPRAPGATTILDQPLVLDTPAQFSVTVDQFVDDYYLLFSTNEGFSFYDIDAVIVPLADPPAPLMGEPFIIRNTARVYRGAANTVKAWVRTEVGKLDMSGVTTLEAVIWSGSGGAFRDGYTPGAWMWPNSGQNLLFTVPATTPETGLVTFQLPPSGNTLRWIPSSLCYTILGDGVPLATGLIEVVG